MSKHPLSNCPPSCMSVKYDSGECVFLQSQRSSAQFTFHSQHTADAMHYDGNLEVGTWKSAMSMPQLHVALAASLVL